MFLGQQSSILEWFVIYKIYLYSVYTHTRFGRWDGYRRKALRCEVVKAEGWALMTHFSEGEKAQFRRAKVIVFHLSHSIPTLKTFPTFYFSFYSFHRKWHLLSILGPVAQIYVDVSNENSTTSPNICRTAVRPFSLSLLHLSLSHFLILYPLFLLYFVFFIDLFFQSPSLGRCGFHTWCEMLFLQRLLTHVCKVFSLGWIWVRGQDKTETKTFKCDIIHHQDRTTHQLGRGGSLQSNFCMCGTNCTPEPHTALKGYVFAWLGK